MKLALPLAIGLLAVTAGTAHAATMTFKYSNVTVNPAGITCKNVSGTLHQETAAGVVTGRITNHTHWCYRYGNGLTQLPNGWTEVSTSLGWDVGDVGYNRQWYTPTHGQATTNAHAHFTIDVPIIGGHLQSWSPNICILVGDKGVARNCP